MSVWRKCAICKKDINHGAIHQVCSVSTCKKHVYCSVDCWNEHVSVMNHKSAWAEEERAPSESAAVSETERSPRRFIVSSSPTTASSSEIPKDVLIVVSKLKAYVKAKHDCNTSDKVIDVLSDYVRMICDEACRKARMEGRKTLMDRDFE